MSLRLRSICFWFRPTLSVNVAGECLRFARKKSIGCSLIRISATRKLDQHFWMNCIAEREGEELDFIFICPKGVVCWATDTHSHQSDAVTVHHLCIMCYTIDTCCLKSQKFYVLVASARRCAHSFWWYFLGSHTSSHSQLLVLISFNSLGDLLLRQSFNKLRLLFPSLLFGVVSVAVWQSTHFEWNQLISVHILWYMISWW